MKLNLSPNVISLKSVITLTFIIFTLFCCNSEEMFVNETSNQEQVEDDVPNPEDEEQNEPEDEAQPEVPILASDELITNQDTSASFSPLTNDDLIPENYTLSLTAATNGVVEINDNETPNDLTDDEIVYIPNEGFWGDDSFEYTVCHQEHPDVCATAIVLVTVNEVEVNVDDEFSSELKAFPGAQGYGKNAKGGRGGRIIKVTNLNDSGAGSFREACEASGARIVIFDVGGRINLSSTIEIRDPYLTIAGQHSVGDGITLSMEGTPNQPIMSVITHDVVLRYITFRRSEFEVSERNSDCLTIFGAHDIIVDHCSFSWASDENIAIYDYDGNNTANVYNITIQNSIIDTAWGGTDKGIICSGGVDRLTFYNLLFTSVGQRAPLIKNEEGNYATEETYFEIINTVTFEGKWHASFPNNIRESGVKHLNYINNLCIDSAFSRNMLFVDTAYEVSLYVKGNISPLRTSISQPTNWDEEWSVIQPGGGAGDVQNTLTTDYRVTIPFNTPIIQDNVELVNAVDLFDSLKDHVGASLPTRDSEDLRAINDVVTRSQSANSTSGKFPTIANGTPLADSDSDGIPNAWEDAYGLDKNVDDAGLDKDGDGYTNIEEYINSIGA